MITNEAFVANLKVVYIRYISHGAVVKRRG